ncbi:Fc.00g044270.m01.CDS01 [Cosmosporella sp. VM-42]
MSETPLLPFRTDNTFFTPKLFSQHRPGRNRPPRLDLADDKAYKLTHPLPGIQTPSSNDTIAEEDDED